ncbi:hypothetical protein PIB30_083959 [Stylosanthes scabra]|uniref:Uncharacterized protein n=1 Tax=Stylosanthes scabra TaxID=79078 RepID=A0ABU6WS69_9FABA|nr:hypothetical protein [Stylosanthes scabra]
MPLSFQAPRRIDDTTSSESASHGDLRGSMRPYMSDTFSDAPGDDPPQGRGRRVRRPPACGTGGCLEAPPARRGRRGGRHGERFIDLTMVAVRLMMQRTVTTCNKK